jgi:hypothetical protein
MHLYSFLSIHLIFLGLCQERTHVVADQTSSEFVKTDFTLQADEAERITVTYTAKVVNQEESGSAGEMDEMSRNLRLFCITVP